MDPHTRILIIRLSSIGDVVHTLPTLAALRRRFPEAHIAWLVEEKSRDVLLGHPLLDEVILFEKDRFRRDLKARPFRCVLREFAAFARELRARRFDIVVDAHGMLRSGVLAWLSGARLRLGLAKSRELNRLFMTRRAGPDPRKHHASEVYLSLARAMGAEGSMTEIPFAITPEARETAGRFLCEHGVGDGDLLVALNPSTSWPSKCWPVAGFAALGDALAAEWGAKVVLLGAPGDLPMIRGIEERLATGPIVAAGKTSLQELAAIAQRCALFVSGDTGPMHIAAAVGTPVVALFGPTDPVCSGPVGDQHLVIRKCPAECGRGCYKRRCVRVEATGDREPETRAGRTATGASPSPAAAPGSDAAADPKCMRAITVEEVLSAAAALLRRQGLAPTEGSGGPGGVTQGAQAAVAPAAAAGEACGHA